MQLHRLLVLAEDIERRGAQQSGRLGVDPLLVGMGLAQLVDCRGFHGLTLQAPPLWGLGERRCKIQAMSTGF